MHHKPSILVHIFHHPVETRNVTIVEVPYRRQTLLQLKEEYVPGQEVLAGYDEKQIEQDAWRYTQVPPDSKVVFVPAAADPATWAFMGFTGWWAAAAYVAVMIGLSYLGGVLFGPDIPERKDHPEGQSHSWNPQTTQTEGIVKPVCYGTNMHYGNIVARWTDVDPQTGDELLYLIIDYGSGPIKGCEANVQGGNVCIGGTPSFNILEQNHINNWYDTAADMNDDDLSSKVGFYGEDNDSVTGKYEAIVEFAASAPIVNSVSFYRRLIMQTRGDCVAYEKVSLYYGAAWHLIYTKNYNRETDQKGLVTITTGGPWLDVTKVKIEVRAFATKLVLFRGVRADHYLYELRAWRVASVSKNLFFNDQPASGYTNVNVQSRVGTLNQTCMTGFEKNKLEYAFREKIISHEGGPILWTSPNNFFEDIEFTIGFPRGLYRQRSSGDREPNSVGVKVEISEWGAEDWSTVLETSIMANQLHPVYKAYSVNTEVPGTVIHGKQYELKYHKTTVDEDPGRIGNQMNLRSCREVVEVAFTRPGRVLLGITALATTDLAGHINVKWIADDKLVNVFDGETWSIKWTRNRAFIDLDELTQPVISGDGDGNPWVIEKYEGLDPSRIDLAAYYEWAQFCDDLVTSGVGEETEKRMPCDIIVDYETNVWKLACEIAHIGRMSPYWQGNILTGWIDKIVAVDDYIDLITMDTIMLNSWKNNWAGHGEMAGGVKVFYRDRLQGYERKPRPVSNANAGLYTRVVAIEGVGVTGHSLATRVGNHALKRNELIKNVNSTRMFKDVLRYKLGQVVRLQNNVPDWGQAFRVVVSEANNTVKLDRIIENVSPGDIVWVKTYDTINKEISLDSYTVESVAGKVLTITTTWEAGCTPLKNHFVTIGVAGDVKTRRIIKMRHTVDNYFNVEFETYDTDLFPSDDEDPQFVHQDYQWNQPTTALAKPISEQRIIELISAMQQQAPSTSNPAISNVNWTGNDVDKIFWDKRNKIDAILFRYLGETFEITPNPTTGTTNEYIYWDPNNPEQFSSTDDASVATAPGCFVVCTNTDGVPHPALAIPLLHAGILQAGTITAALGQIANLAVGTLKIQDNAVTLLASQQDDSWWYLDPSPFSQAGYGLYRVPVWTSSFTSSGAPCQIIFDASVDGTNFTSVTKSMHAIFRAVSDDSELSISAITLSGSNPVKITTTTAHDLSTDDFVWLWDIVGTEELNDAVCKVTYVSSTEFTLQDTRSDWFTAYTSGGKAFHVSLWGLRYGFCYHGHDTGVHISLVDDFLDEGKIYQYIGAVRNRHTSLYGYINEGSTISSLEIKK